MATYLIIWRANTLRWPEESKEVRGIWEAVAAGGDEMLAAGVFKEIRWTSRTSGYCLAECSSQAEVVAACSPFDPYFSYTIEEVVPWEAGRDAVVAEVRRAAGGDEKSYDEDLKLSDADLEAVAGGRAGTAAFSNAGWTGTDQPTTCCGDGCFPRNTTNIYCRIGQTITLSC